SYVLLLDQAGVSVKQAMNLARHSDPKLTMARYGRPQLGDLASAVARLPALAATPGNERSVLRATGTADHFPTGTVSTGPNTGPSLAPKLALTVDSRGEQLKAVEAPTLGCATPESLSHTGVLSTDDGGCGRLTGVGAGAVIERAPGDRRRASLLGEELVP